MKEVGIFLDVAKKCFHKFGQLELQIISVPRCIELHITANYNIMNIDNKYPILIRVCQSCKRTLESSYSLRFHFRTHFRDSFYHGTIHDWQIILTTIEFT